MEVTITITNVWSRISGLTDIELVDSLDRITSYYISGYQYSKAFRNGYFDHKTKQFVHWDGKKHLLSHKMVFPTGLLERIYKFLKRNNVTYTIVDERPPVVCGEQLKIQNIIPRPYQIDAMNVAISKERGIIRMGTGAGKTAVAVMIAASYNVSTMIYVVGTDLLYQFHKIFSDLLGVPIGLIGDGNCIIKKINICSVWTAATSFGLKTNVSLDDADWRPEIFSIGSQEKEAIKRAIQNSNLAIFDEAHFLATETIQSIFKASKKCKYLFGMSGTDWRDDGADLLLESVCGKRIFNMPSSELIKQGYLVPPKIVFYDVPEMDIDNSWKYTKLYSNYIVNNDVRNSLIEDVTRKLIDKGRRVLILVRTIAHGKSLQKRISDIPCFFVNGEVDGETRNEVKEAFERGELKCLIASSVYDIGVDIPCLDALVLSGGGLSSVRTLQRIGRVIRTAQNKKDAIVIDFIDNVKYLDKHSATRIAIYQTESEFKIKFPNGFDMSYLPNPSKIVSKAK
jgi:superfamily II DNA or RNA helicase